MKTFTTIVVASVIVLSGCATTTTPMSMNDADTYIRAADARFAEAFSRSDWNTVGAFYADDAVMLMPNADAMRGAAAIRQSFNMMNGMSPNLRLSTDRVVQSGDLAYQTGTYQMTMTAAGGSAQSDRGKYLTVWRRQPNGDWKIVADMINTSMPARGM